MCSAIILLHLSENLSIDISICQLIIYRCRPRSRCRSCLFWKEQKRWKETWGPIWNIWLQKFIMKLWIWQWTLGYFLKFGSRRRSQSCGGTQNLVTEGLNGRPAASHEQAVHQVHGKGCVYRLSRWCPVVSHSPAFRRWWHFNGVCHPGINTIKLFLSDSSFN